MQALWCALLLSSPDSEDLNCVCASSAPPLLAPSLLATLDCSEGSRASGLVSEDSRSRAALRSAGPPSNLPVCVCGQEVTYTGRQKKGVRRGDERDGDARVWQRQGGVRGYEPC